MFKQFIENTSGLDIYLILSLLMFFVFFIGVSLLLIRMNKKHISYMSELPLIEDEPQV
ncbi:MAG: hypothetical protein ABI390_04340 [Daejeonella sp.]